MEQNTFKKHFFKISFWVLGLIIFILPDTNAQKTTVTLDLTKPGASVSPTLYGLKYKPANSQDICIFMRQSVLCINHFYNFPIKRYLFHKFVINQIIKHEIFF